MMVHKEDVKSKINEPVCHQRISYWGESCISDDNSKVTCKKCLKIISKQGATDGR
jgi:hypothetical protein